jgi:Polyketide cyclase / dehydrase and lipid transport
VGLPFVVKQHRLAVIRDKPGRRPASDVEELPELKPITFSCEAILGIPPEQIAEQFLDLSRWSSFQGYAVLPGIKAAEFEVRTPEIVGSRIRVTNTDGSNHVEEILEWKPDRRIRLQMHEFSRPLSRLATGFEETWDFRCIGQDTKVIRSFELHPSCSAVRPLLWLISILLKRAIARHLRQMRDANCGLEK